MMLDITYNRGTKIAHWQIRKGLQSQMFDLYLLNNNGPWWYIGSFTTRSAAKKYAKMETMP